MRDAHGWIEKRRRRREFGPWTTLDEIQFLENLGSHIPENLRRKDGLGRRELQAMYLLTMRRRKNWGEISRCEIEEYLKEALEMGRGR